jgi:membrane protein required for colicin V production
MTVSTVTMTVSTMTDARRTLSQLDGFDWILIAILAISTVAALRRGLLRTVFGMLGLVAGILIASWNYEQVGRTLEAWISNHATARAVAFLLLVFTVTFAISLLASLLRRTAKTLGLGIVDTLLGGCFGFIRGGLAGVALVIGITAFMPRSDWVAQSKLTPYFLAGAHAVSFVVPPDLKERIANGAWHLKHGNQIGTSSL